MSEPTTTPRFYRAEDIDPLLADVAAVIEKVAAERETLVTENADLKKKAEEAAGGDKVLLQKIASLESRQVFPDEDIYKAVDSLIHNEQLDPAHREKVAGQLRTTPLVALGLLAKVASFSAPGHIEGVGLPKEASEGAAPTPTEDKVVETERSAWSKVASEGA